MITEQPHLPKVKLSMTEGKGSVSIDGFVIPWTVDLAFRAKVGEVPQVSIVMLADFEIESDSNEITIKNGQEKLIKLDSEGWRIEDDPTIHTS